MGAFDEELKATAAHLARRGRGILAADESVGTIGKRLIAHGLENTEEKRRQWREILICAPTNQSAYSGVILFHETVYQNASDGTPFVTVLRDRGILPGVKVDTGLKPVSDSPFETRTSGLDGLADRCRAYRSAGVRFAKWRAALRIDEEKQLPTDAVVDENAATLAAYAAVAQEEGLVPIVEPEILIDGAHPPELSAQVARRVISRCYHHLRQRSVLLPATLLKPMMIMGGVEWPHRNTSTPDIVARMTLDAMRDVVPADVPGIMFLSGGMSEEEATLNLNALNRLADAEGSPWSMSFSFGRALQTSAMDTWRGDPSKVADAMRIAAALGVANATAQLGQFEGNHPSVAKSKTLYEGFRGWRSGDDPKGV